ncbi:hypothetical protein [Nitrospira sp.]
MTRKRASARLHHLSDKDQGDLTGSKGYCDIQSEKRPNYIGLSESHSA